MNRKSKLSVIFILGMHRSGTSCLAGSLAQAGLFMGDVNREAPHNKKGNYENYEIMRLHDTVLSSNRGSWDNPPDSIIWRAAHQSLRDKIIETYPENQTWGFKDPRTTILLEGWLEPISEITIVASFRHPVAVAKSLAARNGFHSEKSFDLWMKYNARVLELVKRFNGRLINFDLSPENYRNQLASITRALNLPGQGTNFFDTRLRVNRNDNTEKIPGYVQNLYDNLVEVSVAQSRRTDNYQDARA